MPIIRPQSRCRLRRKRRMSEIPWMLCVCKERTAVRIWKANRTSCNPTRRNRLCKQCFCSQKSMTRIGSMRSDRRMRLVATIPASPLRNLQSRVILLREIRLRNNLQILRSRLNPLSHPRRPSQLRRPAPVKARITATMEICIRPVNAHGMRITVGRKWASARHPTCIMAENGI